MQTTAAEPKNPSTGLVAIPDDYWKGNIPVSKVFDKI
jgi:hypothetical protein